jgi:hypothetical protein
MHTLYLQTTIHRICGITQDTQTKNYMIVLSNNICKKCNYKCNAMHFQQNFESWTSGNDNIDKFIQGTQLSAHHDNRGKALEWIPYDRFNDIEYIAKGGFGKVYVANWIQNQKREGQNMIVALKSLNNSKNVTLKFMNEVHYLIIFMVQNTEILLLLIISLIFICRLHYIIEQK